MTVHPAHNRTGRHPDGPGLANILAYSLDPGAPPAASISADAGIFLWPTTDANADTTNFITVRVTDNGSPPLSDAQTFAVTVLARPEIQTVTLAKGVAPLTAMALRRASSEEWT